MAEENRKTTRNIHSLEQITELIQTSENGNDCFLNELNSLTPLHSAIENKDPEILQLLLTSSKIDPNRMNKMGRTPLHSSILLQNEEMALILLQDERIQVDCFDQDGVPAIVQASDFQLINVVKTILERGGDVNAMNRRHSTALHSAAERGDLPIVNLLLNHGACVNLQDDLGCTPLNLALLGNLNLEIVSLLVQHGASASIADHQGRMIIELNPSEEVQNILKKSLDYPRAQQILKLIDNSTQFQTSTTHPLDVDYLAFDFLGGGKLGMTATPGRNKRKYRRNLTEDIARLSQHFRVDFLVTLLQEKELQEMGCTHLFCLLKKHNIDYLWESIEDKWIPKCIDQLTNIVHTILKQLEMGKNVVVHCNAGKGRTGMIVSAVLIALGQNRCQAIDLVRTTRSGTIYNPAQKLYVSRFVAHWSKINGSSNGS
jgi:ankyrin repeat protein/protein-tyrosine phosphatase